MKKYSIYFFLIVTVVTWYLAFRIEKAEKKKTVGTVDSKPALVAAIDARRTPAAHTLTKTDAPSQKYFHFKKNKSPKKLTKKVMDVRGLPSGLKLSTDTFAVLKENYSGSLGTVIRSTENFLIVQSSQMPSGSQYVAVDVANDQYFPISSVIKLTGIDETQRSSLISKGLSEHYYSEDLQIMFVQAPEDQLFSLYDELDQQDLRPSLEVIRGFNRAR